MDLECLGVEARKALVEILGYLNFSSGAADPSFLSNVNRLFGAIRAQQASDGTDKGGQPEKIPAWRVMDHLIREELDHPRDSSEAFQEVRQAEAVRRLVFEDVLPAYRRFHRDLLFHQTEESLFQPLFIGRVCEAVLSEGEPWDESRRVVDGALGRINDFLGHRPVAVLENRRKLQPYAHEWVRPIPLFIDQVGPAVGRYHDLIERTLRILRETDADLLQRAWFDPALLEELSLDPRAFDFDHPINRRPNYHFGGWDPYRIDNRGQYRRFVLQQVTIDGLLGRLEEAEDLPREEVLFETAAVLAGTMLMGSGITGSGPDAHSSETTLATLLPHVAAYRDEFYERLLQRLPEPHARRLRAEAAALRQPFAAARQDLNHRLARRRSQQLQHVHLAQLFARMGYTEAAGRQARVVPVASARMRCEIECRLATAELAIVRGELEAAAERFPEIKDLLHRAIECGALVDPWNILGFGAQYSLFPAVENSVHDHRVDELIELMNDIFGLSARLENEAAAAGRDDLRQTLSRDLGALTQWWDQFASTEVAGIQGFSGRQICDSAAQVATALGSWHRAGTAAGDVAFWRQHVDQFRSPKAYALLVEALLEQQDLIASMALLTHWLSSADVVPLAEGDYSFHVLADCWMQRLVQPPERSAPGREAGGEHPWTLAGKFLDYLEANAGDYWEVPRFELQDGSSEDPLDEETAEAEDEADDLFGAAYENVTYRDTTDDGFDGEMLEGGYQTTDFELSLETERISDRVAFLVTLARLWRLAATAPPAAPDRGSDRDRVLGGWLSQANVNREKLLELLDTVHRYRIPPPRGTREALLEYDRRRTVKEVLLDRIISACVEVEDARRFVLAAAAAEPAPAESGDWVASADRLLRQVFQGQAESVRAGWDDLLDVLTEQPLLYIPTSRGGNPRKAVASRFVQNVLIRLLQYLPRLGLLTETYELLQATQEMERDHPAGQGAITEYDLLFEIGSKGIIQCLASSSEDWQPRARSAKSRHRADLELIDCLEEAMERLLRQWLSHSRNIRISVLETVTDARRWAKLRAFIERYGRDLFTQPFMNFSNLRAILHQGVDRYLESLEEEPDAAESLRLLDDLGRKISRKEAVRWLELAIEAVVENYPEYVDYNSTTTQSDRGDLLYTLLDFLRLEASYDRVAWNLKPVVTAHEVLIRQGRTGAASLWRQAVARRSSSVADDHLKRYGRMCRKHGMRLPTISDRLGERFVRPLAIDRLCSLVQPAIDELAGGGEPAAFALLEEEAESFTEEPGGVGYDLPSWLEALEGEVQRVRSRGTEYDEPFEPSPQIPQVRLPRAEVQRQMDSWEED
jgi:hypothetical protein